MPGGVRVPYSPKKDSDTTIRGCLCRGPSGFIWLGEVCRRFGGRWPGARGCPGVPGRPGAWVPGGARACSVAGPGCPGVPGCLGARGCPELPAGARGCSGAQVPGCPGAL